MSKKEETGHNSGVSADKMRSYVTRIEKLQQERSDLGADIRDIFAEAKSNGFDTKAMREVIKLRKMDREKRETFEYNVALYSGVFS